MTSTLKEGDIITFRHTTGFGLTLELTGNITDICNGKFSVLTIDMQATNRCRQHSISPSQIIDLVRSAPTAA